MSTLRRKFNERIWVKGVSGCLPDEKKMNSSSRKGFGINEVIGIAAGVIIAAVIVIPGLRTFGLSVMSTLNEWWAGISVNIFG